MLPQRRGRLRFQLGRQGSILARRDQSRATGDRLGRDALPIDQLAHVAVDRAHTDTEEVGHLRLPVPRCQGIQGVLPQIE